MFKKIGFYDKKKTKILYELQLQQKKDMQIVFGCVLN